MRIAVAKECRDGEHRVALVPAAVPPLVRAGCEVWIESNAGAGASFTNEAYADAGAIIIVDDLAIWEHADVLLMVGPLVCVSVLMGSGIPSWDSVILGQKVCRIWTSSHVRRSGINPP